MPDMDTNNKSNAKWYCSRDSEADIFYEFLFKYCNKYNVRWASATEKERFFIEEITRVSYERDKALREGTPLSEVRPAFDDKKDMAS